MNNRRWTKEEDAVLLKAMKDNAGNFVKAFEAAAHLLNRTTRACNQRWYTHLAKEADKKNVAMVTLSSNAVAVNKKNFNTSKHKVKKGKKKGFRALWNSILKSLMV